MVINNSPLGRENWKTLGTDSPRRFGKLSGVVVKGMRSGIITDVITRQGPRVRERKGRTECYCRCRYHPQVDGPLTDELDFERGSPNWKEAAAAAQVAVVVADQVESVGYRDRARALLLLLFNSIRKDGQTLNIFPHSSSLFFLLLLLLIIIYILDLHHHTRSWKAFICFGSRAVRARAPAGHARGPSSSSRTRMVDVDEFFTYLLLSYSF